MRITVVCALLALLLAAPAASAEARPAPRGAPTLADLWSGRAMLAPQFEVVTGVGPQHQRVSFVPGPNGQMLAFSRAQCGNRAVQSAPFCVYRSASADGLHFDEAGRAQVLSQRNHYDPSVIRLPNGWYLMAFEHSGLSIGLATSPDGLDWQELHQNLISSCAADLGFCKRLGGAPNRGSTNYNRFSVSTPALAYRANPDGHSYTIYLYFAPRVNGSAADDQAQLALGLATFAVPMEGRPRVSGLSYQRDLVLTSDPQGQSWDRRTISAPCIVGGGDGAWYMLYEGAPQGFGNIGQPWSIGLARSTDGVAWTKYRADGLLMPATQPAGADDQPNLERGARSYPGWQSLGGRSFVTQAYRGADNQTRGDYIVRYQVLWRR